VKNIILALIVLTLAACATPRSAEFKYACNAVNEEFILATDPCTAPNPEVIVTAHMPTNLLGAHYPKEKRIYISSNQDVASESDILVHELVHYFLKFSRPYVTRCQSEAGARRITSKYMGIEYNDKWRLRYDC